jgi:hypothetical protein
VREPLSWWAFGAGPRSTAEFAYLSSGRRGAEVVLDAVGDEELFEL